MADAERCAGTVQFDLSDGITLVHPSQVKRLGSRRSGKA
jgi:hypothetical protein